MKRRVNRMVRLIRPFTDLNLESFSDEFLISSIHNRMRETNTGSEEEYSNLLISNNREAELLAGSLLNSHSEFFRNPVTFAYLEQSLLPALLQQKEGTGEKEIRIWSAGCAMGQEPYSVAIIAEETTSRKRSSVKYRIFATDLQQANIVKAITAEYPLQAIQNIPHQYCRNYFTNIGDKYIVRESLRQNVSFSQYDLLDEHSYCPPVSIFGDFDLVICCNVLFYYNQKSRDILLDKFCYALRKGGYFIAGEAESSIVESKKGFRKYLGAACVFKKE